MKILLMGAVTFALLPLANAQDDGVDADRIYKKSCRKCHDKDGSGGTPAGKKLKVKDYSKASNQAQFTDEEAFKAIREGVNDKDGEELMEAYPDFSDAEVNALVALVRSFAKPE
ncbi:MAG: c-type cytochrome [Verrucomicrobiae bacterium]|nr:c-type cytochrome [Verrucomicrobiae bacterium]